jgi:hypothetical protein
VYASELAGLGISLTPGFTDLGRGFFIPIADEAEPQAPVAFTLTFTKAPYHTYKQLMDWIATAGRLMLVYNPTGSQEYYRDITLEFAQKGELSAVGWLETPCSFLCSTPWYLPTPTPINIESADTGDDKIYDYMYSDSLRYRADSVGALVATIAGAGHIPGALVLRVYGGITNPRIRLAGSITGKTYGICSVSGVIDAQDVLEFSTKYGDSYIKKIPPVGAQADLLDALDLQLDPFFHIPISEPCTLFVESDGLFIGQADILVYYYYRSV